MRKIFMFLFAFVLFIPISLNAKEIKINDEFKLSLDENEWYIFTKDNLKDNPDLDSLNITYDYMNNFMITNNVSLDAIVYLNEDFTDYLELIIQINSIDDKDYDYEYLGYLSKGDLKDVAEEVGNKLGSNNSKVYDDGKYTYIKSEYVKSSESNMHYYTVVNNKGYNFMFKKMKSFTDDDKKIVNDILSTVKFDVPEKSFQVSNSVKYTIIVALIAGCASGLANLSKKKKLKELEKETD